MSSYKNCGCERILTPHQKFKKLRTNAILEFDIRSFHHFQIWMRRGENKEIKRISIRSIYYFGIIWEQADALSQGTLINEKCYEIYGVRFYYLREGRGIN